MGTVEDYLLYTPLHFTKVSTVVILVFNIAYNHLFIVLIRLSQQAPIHGLMRGLNWHLILCLFK